MSHKEIAASFLNMAGSGDVKAAYDKFIAPDFIHHNQYFKGDRQSLLMAMEDAHKTRPNKSVNVKQTFEDGNFVITHSRVRRADPKQSFIAVVHIFRFKGDRVVELWDLGQELISDSPNENGSF
jgi:predicted SnoaL-like aldol condensation-catalyzing enzyme